MEAAPGPRSSVRFAKRNSDEMQRRRSTASRHQMKSLKVNLHARIRGLEVFAPSNNDNAALANIDSWNPAKNPNMEKTPAERRFIEESLSDGDNFIFEFMPQDRRNMIIDHMENISYRKGGTIIKQGEECDYFYIIEEGDVAVYVSKEQQDLALQTADSEDTDFAGETPHETMSTRLADWIGGYSSMIWNFANGTHNNVDPNENLYEHPDVLLGRGDTFGEIALLYNCPRMATCIAHTSCTVWRLDVLVFRHIMEMPDLDLRSSVDQTTAIRSSLSVLMYTTNRKNNTSSCSHIYLLEDVPFLRERLDNASLDKLARVMIPVRFRAGEIINPKGTDGDTFYIIKSGQVRIYDRGFGDSQTSEVIAGAGDHFGEQALLENQKCNANYMAVTETITLALSKEQFKKTLGSLRDIMSLDYVVKQLVSLSFLFTNPLTLMCIFLSNSSISLPNCSLLNLIFGIICHNVIIHCVLFYRLKFVLLLTI
mmetsp:Transcript_67982/g.100880  ORF Transcript_67982/g.100880 Transcript_67982/m.100880 type:complete len:482 (+) Transcript_67982:66-1511(+)